MRKIIEIIASFLPAKLGAWLEYGSKNVKIFYGFGGAMNGQTARLEAVREIIVECGIQRIVETGTFRGVTTAWFSSFGVPVDSVEVSRRFAEFSKIRLRNKTNVSVINDGSIAFLRKDIEAGENLAERTLFYLDAHWYDDLPLREEYELISKNYKSSVIVIDDFQVPDDPEYGFDDYGAGKALNLKYLFDDDADLSGVFFPRTSGRWETGAKRGCVVIAKNAEFSSKIEEKIPLLRKWTKL